MCTKCLLLTFLTRVRMPLEPIVEVFLRAVDARIGPREAVHLPIHAIVETLLHIRLIVEVGHLPAILFVVVVVSVCRVVGWSDGLRVWRVRSVVEVHLGSVLVYGWC